MFTPEDITIHLFSTIGSLRNKLKYAFTPCVHCPIVAYTCVFPCAGNLRETSNIRASNKFPIFATANPSIVSDDLLLRISRIL